MCDVLASWANIKRISLCVSLFYLPSLSYTLIYKSVVGNICTIPIFFKTPLQGTQTNIYHAVSEEMEGVTGRYLADCKIAKTKNPQATDDELAEKLCRGG